MWHEEPNGSDAEPASPRAAIPLRANVGQSLLAGLMLTAFQKPDPRRLTGAVESFWAALLVAAAWYAGIDYFMADPPRQFSARGFEGLAVHCLLVLLVCHLLLRQLGREALLWSLAALFTYGALIPAALYAIAWNALPDNDDGNDIASGSLYAVKMLWWAALFWRALCGLASEQPENRRLALSLLAAGLLGAASWALPSTEFWQTDYEALYGKGAHEEPLLAEDVLPQQPALLARAMDRIAPGTSGKPSLYFVSFAPYASQGVFAREAHFTEHLFENDFGARNRTLTLINSRESVATSPLASVSNLRAALLQLGRKMIPDQDILFLYLTSHGSRDGELSVDLPDVGLHALGAKDLAGMLDAAGIRWRVIVVSSCYSGTFIPALRNDHTLIITAARADRTSFGCSDEADFTYFGRAYFQQALGRTSSFVDAFGIARDLINQWETAQNIQHAEPQIDTGSLIQARLEQWQATLPPRKIVAVPPPAAGDPASTPGKEAQQARVRRNFQRLHEASLALLSIVLVVMFFAQLRAWLRHRDRGLLLLTLSSVVGLATLPLQIMATASRANLDGYLQILYASFSLTVLQWLGAVFGTLALLRSYGNLADRVRVQADTPTPRPENPA